MTEFNYRYADANKAVVFVGVQLSHGMAERLQIIETLKNGGYEVDDLTDNEVAKLHVRHMVGGRAGGIENEWLYRFRFPDRPGALAKFLNSMGPDWNISLFHYRNHGAAYGRVLVGLQVPNADQHEFKRFVDQLGYSYWSEDGNAAYVNFLA